MQFPYRALPNPIERSIMVVKAQNPQQPQPGAPVQPGQSPQQPQQPNQPQPQQPQQPGQQPPKQGVAPDVPFDTSDMGVAARMVNERIPAGMVDPATLQVLMSLMIPAITESVRASIQEFKKPTPDEQAKLDAEINRIKEARIRAAEQGKAIAAQEAATQRNCQHVKPNGKHTFRGQVHSDGWAEIKCIRCLVTFRVRPLPEHVAQGLRLEDVQGLTIQHLQAWQANSAQIDARLKAAEYAMRQMTQEFTGANPTNMGAFQ
jgi:Sec-independent protein translocase protein TatA